MKFSLILVLTLFSFSLFAQSQIDFAKESLQNENISFSEINKENVVLLNFWATWCKPCVTEMKHLESIFEEYKNQNFTIIGVNQDSPRSLAKVKSFVKSHNLSFPIITDTDQEIFQKFNSQSIPLNVLVDKNGEILFTKIGYLPGDEIEIEEEIQKALKK